MSILINLLIVVGIIVLIALSLILFKISKILSKVDNIVNDNKSSIDNSILEVSRNLEESAKLLKTINLKEKELRETIDNVDVIVKDVSVVTTATADAVEKSEEVITSLSKTMKNFNNISSMFKNKKEGEKNE